MLSQIQKSLSLVISSFILFLVGLTPVSAEVIATVEPLDQNQAQASIQQAAPLLPTKFQAQITLHSPEELQTLLLQAEKIANGETQYSTSEPIAIVLHGEEIRAFARSNYRDNKELVDLAARLDAFKVVDIKVCQRWMGGNGFQAGDLPPFIEPVSWGAGEVKKLQEEGYAFF